MRVFEPVLVVLLAFGSGCGVAVQSIVGWNRVDTRHTDEGEQTVVTPRAWGMLGTGIGELVLGASLAIVGSQASDCYVDEFGFVDECYRTTLDNALLGTGISFAILGAVDMIWGFIRLFSKPEIQPKSLTTELAEAPPVEADAEIVDTTPEAIVAATKRDTERVVAVMDVEGTIGKDIIRNVSDQIRVFIAQQGAKTIDRSAQDRAFKERVRSMKKESYQQCYDDSCQLELGKALAASHIVRSSISKFGTRCVLNGELIDLTSEVTVKAASAQGSCKAEGFLEMSEAIARQLMKK